jgi:hypothetical protein
MPRDGALTLSDVRSPMLAIVCEPCGRRGRYNLERLMAEQADRAARDPSQLPESEFREHQ